MMYKDRSEAGRVLAGCLERCRSIPCLVIGLPNGGIPVGIEIARGLGFDFDLLFVSKITPKFNTEIGYGAVSESGKINLNRDLVMRLGITREDMAEDIRTTRRKVEFRVRNLRLRGGRRDVRNRTVILTDDGLASGYTMINAIATVRERGANEIVVAVPTAPLGTYNTIATLADDIVCPDIRDSFVFAVADAYERWHDIDYEGALKLLKKSGYIDE
ncbi:MAG: phosphoribosyltransferase [Spirochaetes bacterium]|nr:phosphoribosyltransferase [Spirochaetota bacterium]